MGDLRQDVLCVTAQLHYHVDFLLLTGLNVSANTALL